MPKSIAAVVGGYLVWTVVVLAGLLLATGVPVQLSAWELVPGWYPPAFLVALVPVTWLGGRPEARPV